MTKNRTLTSGVCLAALLASAVAFGQAEKAEKATKNNKPEMTLKVYRVADLFTPRPDYPYRGGLPTTDVLNQNSNSASGGFGGGGLGGGGIFQVPDIPRVAQFGGDGGGGVGGGSGLGGLGGGGFGGAGIALEPGPGVDEALRFTLDDLVHAITITIMPDTWEDVGGDAVCTPLGGMLLITQTAEAHKQIEQLLSDIRTEGGNLHTVTVDATWLSLTAEDFEKLATKQNGQGGGLSAIDPALVKELAAKNPSWQGRISCYNDQTVHLVSGSRRTVVVNAIPTVGAGSSGYTPVIAVPNVGLLLQVRPTVDSDRASAVLNVTSTLTEWMDGGEPLAIQSDDEPIKVQGVTTKGGRPQVTIDRVNLNTQHLGTTARVPIGQPVLIGGLSKKIVGEDTPAEHANRQLYLIMKLTVNEAAAK